MLRLLSINELHTLKNVITVRLISEHQQLFKHTLPNDLCGSHAWIPLIWVGFRGAPGFSGQSERLNTTHVTGNKFDSLKNI